MTTPYERNQSLIGTYEFLRELAEDMDIPESTRRQAKALLRHYPTAQVIELEGQVQMRCREELALVADKHGPLHPVLASWLAFGSMV
ncbi:MAG: BPSL0761 family protein [Pseudomonas sp.]